MNRNYKLTHVLNVWVQILYVYVHVHNIKADLGEGVPHEYAKNKWMICFYV